MATNTFNKDESNFKINVNSYLGIEYNAYKSRLQGLSLSQPSTYFKYREGVETYIKKTSLENLYNTLFYAMKDGLDVKGAPMVTLPVGSPCISPQVINEISISIARTLDKALDEVIALICPVYLNQMAMARTQLQGAGTGIV